MTLAAHSLVITPIMSATASNSPLRKQASAAVDTVASEIQTAVRQELDALRNSMNVRLAALDRVLARDQNAFDPIVEKLCEVAGEQAEAACTWTRAQLEAAAAKELEAVRGRAQDDLHAAQALMEETRADFERRLAQADAATAHVTQALADLRAATDAALLERDQRLAQSEAARVATDEKLAETECAAAVARQDADDATASLAEARTQIATLERIRADLQLGRDIAEAHLEGEVHHRNVIAAELEAAREKALHAKADADARGLEVQRAAARIRVLEEQRPPHDPTSAADPSGDAAAIVDHVRTALQKLSAAATGRALLDAALESMGEHFSRVALCAVSPQGCTVWGSRGFDPPLETRKAVVPLAADSPLSRALADWKPAVVRLEDGAEASGLVGGLVAYAIALPIVAQDRSTVMLYGENPLESSCGDPRVGERIAGILMDQLGQRLRSRRTAAAAEPPAYLPARQAPRVKIPQGADVAVDGAHSTLVDLSMLGAQVLSPRAMRPNGSVRLQLPNETGALSCEGRVVWVLVEQGEDRQHALYRAGVQFTRVDAPELEAYFSQRGLFDRAIRH